MADWRTVWQYATTGGVPRRSLAAAVVVGSVLNLINQGDALFAAKPLDWTKLALTYLVPYCVTTTVPCRSGFRPSDRVESHRRRVWGFLVPDQEMPAQHRHAFDAGEDAGRVGKREAATIEIASATRQPEIDRRRPGRHLRKRAGSALRVGWVVTPGHLAAPIEELGKRQPDGKSDVCVRAHRCRARDRHAGERFINPRCCNSDCCCRQERNNGPQGYSRLS